MYKFVLILTALVIFCARPAPAQEAVANINAAAPDNGILDIYLAKDNGAGRAGTAEREFRPNDIPIYCVVQLNSSVSATVRMKLIAVRVAGVKPETIIVSTAYTTTGKQNRVNFAGRPDGKWTPGIYRADIFIGARLAGSREFKVAAAERPPARTPKPKAHVLKK